MTPPSRWLLAGLVALAVVLVFWPLADLTANVWPILPGNLQWRYGAAGLLANFLHTPLLGLAVGLGVALWVRSTSTLRVLGAFSLVSAGLVGIVMVVFALDLAQIRDVRPPESVPVIMVGGALSELKYLSTLVVLLLLGIGAWRTGARVAATGRRSAQREQGTVVVGSGERRSAPERAATSDTGGQAGSRAALDLQ